MGKKSKGEGERDASGLTPRQRRFVAAYLQNPNAAQAAAKAGYSAKSARVNGPRLLSNAAVASEIAAGQTRIAAKAEVDAEYVLHGLKEVAQRCMTRVPVMVGQGKERHQATSEEGEGVWEFDSAGANRALELLGKHLKLFTEKVEHSGAIESRVSVVVNGLRRGAPTPASPEKR